MKILYTASVLSHICQFHLPTMEALKKQGDEIHVAARDNLAEKNGLKLEFCDCYYNIPFQRSPKDTRNIGAYKQLRRLLNEQKYDVVICNTPVVGILTRLAARTARKHGTKVVYIAHGFHFYKGAPKKYWMIYPIEKIFADKYTDLLITINEEDFQRATEKFKCAVAHIHGIGVCADRYHPFSQNDCISMREKEGLSEKAFAILCTGELNKNKDQKTLIAAAEQVKKVIPNLCVLFAGNGPLENEFREQVSLRGLNDTVKFLGYRTDLEKVVPAMDLIVSCSHREGLPLNIMEAMLCKKPVVASRNRGHNELVEDGKTGFLFSCGDVEALAARIAELAQDAALSAKMGEAGFQKVQQYTVSAVQAELAKLFSELLERKSAIKT